MPRLTKTELLARVERGFQAGGWSVLYLTGRGEHPARYRIARDGISISVKAYVWNVSHGGGPRSAAEYRIQITGITPHQFIPEVGGKTLILGYWDNEDVFAGFDFNFHAVPLGGSPSIQVGEQALSDANEHRFAVHRKGNGELVIAFRPDFIGTYVNHLAALHATGQVPAEADLLARLAADPEAVPAAEIDTTIAGPRQIAITQTKRALRALDFRDRVLTAYSHRCAMCGVQLRLLDGAHIGLDAPDAGAEVLQLTTAVRGRAVSEPASTDQTSNGVALCALHHRAYDRGLLTFDRKFKMHVSARHAKELSDAGHDGGMELFRNALRRVIHLPPALSDRPNPTFVAQANSLRGWAISS